MILAENFGMKINSEIMFERIRFKLHSSGQIHNYYFVLLLLILFLISLPPQHTLLLHGALYFPHLMLYSPCVLVGKNMVTGVQPVAEQIVYFVLGGPGVGLFCYCVICVLFLSSWTCKLLQNGARAGAKCAA